MQVCSSPPSSAPSLEMKRELDGSDDNLDMGLSQASSLAASSSSSSQLTYGSCLTLDLDIEDCDSTDSAPDSDNEHFAPPLEKFFFIVLSLGTVGLAMVSALAGCDYGDATTGIELAINAVHPVAISQAQVHKLGDISSGSHFFQCPPNSSALPCYFDFLQSLMEETLKNLSSPQSKRKSLELKKKNRFHHLEIVLVFLTQTVYDDTAKVFKPLRLFPPRSGDSQHLPLPGALDMPGTIVLLHINKL